MSIEFGFPFKKAEKGRAHEKRVYGQLLFESHNAIDLSGTVPTDEYGTPTALDTKVTPSWTDSEGFHCTLTAIERDGDMPAVGTRAVPPCHYEYHLAKRHSSTNASKEFMYRTFEDKIYTLVNDEWIMYGSTKSLRVEEALKSLEDFPKEAMALENRDSFRKQSYPVKLTNFVFESLDK